ncbi:MAG: hypothetical protein AAFX90_19425 [Pseudomonadota bacterium]
MNNQDPYSVYRPLLNLIGHSEGTDKGDGYNETLAYGEYTGGDVDLVSMSLRQIDALQTKMLAHPKNSWNSSAIGRYQIVRTTLRKIKETLDLSDDLLFDRAMQDRMGCYLLGVRGIDKWLAGRLSDNTMLLNLAKEWASLPTPEGKGYYGGQRAHVTVIQVKAALADVRALHRNTAPAKPVVPVPLDKPVVKQVSFWERILQVMAGGGLAFLAPYLQDWRIVAGIGATVVALAFLGIFFQGRLAKSIKAIKEAAG